MDEYGEIQKISKFSLNVLEKPSNSFIVNTLSLAMLDNMVKPGKRWNFTSRYKNNLKKVAPPSSSMKNRWTREI